MMSNIIRIKKDSGQRSAVSGQKKNILLIILSLLSVILLNSIAFTEPDAKEQKQEDRVSTEQVFESNLEKYEKAVEEDPDSDVANYNLGTAYYRKGQYEKSIESFMKSLNTEDREIEVRAIYNMANSKYRLGSMQAESDLNSAIGHYKESLDYYRRAMELDEADRDAKYNHELVEKKIKILMDKMKNQQQQQQDQDQNQNEDKDQENKEGQGSGDQQQQKQEDQKQQNAEKERSGESQDKGKSEAEQNQEEQEMQSAGKEEESPEQMSPEEARMLLEAYGQDEAREEVNQKMRGRYGEVLRDW